MTGDWWLADQMGRRSVTPHERSGSGCRVQSRERLYGSARPRQARRELRNQARPFLTQRRCARQQPAGLTESSRWSFGGSGGNDHRNASPKTSRTPAGVPEIRFNRNLQQVLGIIVHPVLFEQPFELVHEGSLLVVRLLARDVSAQRCHMGPAYAKNRVALLPGKPALEVLRHPKRRGFLDFPREIRRSMRRFQTYQQMHMVLHASDRFGNPAQPAHGDSQVLMSASAPFRPQKGPALFGAKHDVVMEAVKGATHN